MRGKRRREDERREEKRRKVENRSRELLTQGQFKPG